MVRFTLLTIFDKCNFGDCDFSFLLTSQPPLISFSKKWWHLPFFPAVKFAEADKMSVLERSGLCHSEATNIGHLEKSYLAGGDREYLSTEKKTDENSFYVTQWMPWQYSLYLRHWSRRPNLVNTWHQKYFIFVRMMANILRDKLISFGWLFAFSYTLFWIWSLQVVFEVSLLLQQQHCCTTLVFCHSYALNELSTLAAALACLHKAKLSKKSVSKTLVQVLLIQHGERSELRLPKFKQCYQTG